MKKNLPYFLVIAALIFLIIGVLSSGREKAQSVTQEYSDVESREIINNDVEAAQESESDVVSSQKLFNVYTDKRAPDNHYAPSGWMGDFGDISLNDQYMENPHSGSTCIQFIYSAKKTQGAGWAGLYWQSPPNNWGEKMGGFDLSGYNKLVFWAPGKKWRRGH